VKIAVLSDIHSNLEALTAALDAVDAAGIDTVYVLGDIVGYGADAPACVELVQRRAAGVVRGNHDDAVSLQKKVKVLPRDGRAAAIHNRALLTPAQLDYLANLPFILEADGCTFVHATPREPAAWLRLASYTSAQEQFTYFRTDVCFVGHTHIPAVMAERLGVLRVRPGNRYLINAGSVGQPRDQNPKACVAFFDTGTFDFELVRVSYDIEGAAGKIVAAGLPASLAERLKVGR
jgi:putative phosphoesterase